MRLIGEVIKGHQVASGLAENTPFTTGTISLQKPLFKRLGLNLSKMYAGTINLQFPVASLSIVKAHYAFDDIKWHEDVPAECFQFIACQVRHHKSKVWLSAYIYQPVKETKIGHHQPENVLEILTSKIDNLRYGDKIELRLADKMLSVNY